MTAPHIFLVAGEESGDRLGAALMTALKERANGIIAFSGVGGSLMAEQGLVGRNIIGELPTIGFSRIPLQVAKILRLIREAADAAIAAKPDVMVVIDNPEFTHRVARRVRARAPSIRIVDYVCPSVWAWRPGRARTMRGYVDQVLALLPFEPAVMQKLGGPATTYVGHPLAERVADLRPSASDKSRRSSDTPLLLVLPGSRKKEIAHMAGVFGATVARLADQIGPLEVVVPSVPRLRDVVLAETAHWRAPARIVTEPSEKYAAFRQARAALTKSGTSTLELALSGIPMVAGYKVSPLEAFAGWMLINGITSVILANLVLGENVVPEFLQGDCTAEKLSAALLPLFGDSPERRRQVTAFERLDAIMEIGTAVPSRRAAAAVYSYVLRA